MLEAVAPLWLNISSWRPTGSWDRALPRGKGEGGLVKTLFSGSSQLYHPFDAKLGANDSHRCKKLFKLGPGDKKTRIFI